MAQQPPTAQAHLDSLRSLMSSLTPDQRGAAHQFWRGIRQALYDQDAEVNRLQAIVTSLAGSQPAPRPHTSQSVIAVRDAVENVIQTEAQLAADASTTIEEICDLDPTWALEFIRKQRAIYIQTELGCWVSGAVAGHSTGYVKVNMRNTRKPDGTGAKFSSQPWIHQMGVVAGGNGYLLRLTTNGSYHVSQLYSSTGVDIG